VSPIDALYVKEQRRTVKTRSGISKGIAPMSKSTESTEKSGRTGLGGETSEEKTGEGE